MRLHAVGELDALEDVLERIKDGIAGLIGDRDCFFCNCAGACA